VKRLVALLGVLTALAAGAYVLPGPSILRRMVGVQDESQPTSARVEGSYVFSGPAVKEAAAALNLPTERSELVADGVILLRAQGRCRFELSVPEGNKLAVVQVGGRRRVEGMEIPSLTAAISQLCPLLAVRSASEHDTETRDAVEQHLQSLGIATRNTSLARFGDVAYVLGDPEEGKPQFWVYKDAFRPARVLWKDKSGTAWDVRFIDYTSPATGEWMPRSIEVWRDGQRTLRFTAIKADTHAALPDKLFAP
jgi:hypothetical protein